MKLTSLALAAALSLAAGSSLAQPAPAPGAEHHHGMRADPAQMGERHAQRLRAALQLRPDQEPALRGLVAAMQPPPGAHERMGKDHEDLAGLTTPQRLDRMAARQAEHEAHFRQHADAVKRFYAQLSPTQQKAFDAMPMMGMHEHGMRGHEHGEHGGPGMKHGPGGHDHGAPPPAGA